MAAAIPSAIDVATLVPLADVCVTEWRKTTDDEGFGGGMYHSLMPVLLNGRRASRMANCGSQGTTR